MHYGDGRLQPRRMRLNVAPGASPGGKDADKELKKSGVATMSVDLLILLLVTTAWFVIFGAAMRSLSRLLADISRELRGCRMSLERLASSAQQTSNITRTWLPSWTGWSNRQGFHSPHQGSTPSFERTRSPWL